jgi:broad specificity phosphatase PhoE
MRHLLIAVSLWCFLVGSYTPPPVAQAGTVQASTTVILVRHAERAPGEGDVPISAAGRARAQALAQVLRDTDIRTIITSQMLRTKETAEPLAQHKRITPDVIPADKLDAVVEKIRSLGGGTVLVVHHSNTVPALVEKFGGETAPIRDDEFDRLVILTILRQSSPSVVTLRYGAPSLP